MNVKFFADNADYIARLREEYPPPHPAVQIAQAAQATARVQWEAQLEAARDLYAALEPFAEIWRATTPMMRPHAMAHSEEWYKRAAEAQAKARAAWIGGKP